MSGSNRPPVKTITPFQSTHMRIAQTHQRQDLQRKESQAKVRQGEEKTDFSLSEWVDKAIAIVRAMQGALYQVQPASSGSASDLDRFSQSLNDELKKENRFNLKMRNEALEELLRVLTLHMQEKKSLKPHVIRAAIFLLTSCDNRKLIPLIIELYVLAQVKKTLDRAPYVLGQIINAFSHYELYEQVNKVCEQYSSWFDEKCYSTALRAMSLSITDINKDFCAAKILALYFSANNANKTNNQVLAMAIQGLGRCQKLSQLRLLCDDRKTFSILQQDVLCFNVLLTALGLCATATTKQECALRIYHVFDVAKDTKLADRITLTSTIDALAKCEYFGVALRLYKTNAHLRDAHVTKVMINALVTNNKVDQASIMYDRENFKLAMYCAPSGETIVNLHGESYGSAYIGLLKLLTRPDREENAVVRINCGRTTHIKQKNLHLYTDDNHPTLNAAFAAINAAGLKGTRLPNRAGVIYVYPQRQKQLQSHATRFFAEFFPDMNNPTRVALDATVTKSPSIQYPQR